VRRFLAIAILTALPLVCGCGNRNLILTVDVLSFLDPSSRQESYGPIPSGFPQDTVDVFSDSLNLLPGIGDLSRVASASLKVGASFDNASGAANAEFLVYFAGADSSDPFKTTPIADIPVQLLPGQVTNVNTEIDASPALAEALTHDRAKVGIRLVFSGTSFPVQGVETLTQLTAIVVLKQDL
jgi:hypothetical protein